MWRDVKGLRELRQGASRCRRRRKLRSPACGTSHTTVPQHNESRRKPRSPKHRICDLELAVRQFGGIKCAASRVLSSVELNHSTNCIKNAHDNYDTDKYGHRLCPPARGWMRERTHTGVILKAPFKHASVVSSRRVAQCSGG